MPGFLQRAAMWPLLIVLVLLAGCSNEPRETDTPQYDVVIYGGTSAAITAAVQVIRMGKSAVIVGPDKHLGGLTAGGLGWTDSGKKDVIGGLARDFYHRVWQHYEKPEAWKWQKREDYGNKGQGTAAIDGANRTMWIFEPGVAERVYEELVAEYKIPVHRDEWLNRESGVEVEDGSIKAITMLSGKRYAARMFLDATYEGDLMAAAGVSYDVGREANSVYGEALNGVQKDVRHHGHFFPKPVSPYVTPGDPSSGLLPRVHDSDPGENGQGDDRIQAYCFRMCLTTVTENRVPFTPPAGYDPMQYELLARAYSTGWDETFHKFDPIPNLKTDTNNHGPFSTDNIGMNYDYPEATYERRREIIAEHEQYQKGLMYFIANDPKVPGAVRAKMSQWGLAKDEFTDNGNWPHQIYVRESRRMLGEYVMSELDCLGTKETPRSIGMGSYTADSHNVQRYVTADGYVQNEGDVGVRLPGPYKISYGSLTPKTGEADNLLVPVCVSASHIAFGSVRMEPVFMILGQSAATAAVMAIDAGIPVQDVPYEQLRERLLADGQVLETAAASGTE
jgi:FAD-dependent oxidoreductase family protein